MYNPLVTTAGTKPAVKPVVPKLPKGAIVTIDFGFNGTFLLQKGATPDALSQGQLHRRHAGVALRAGVVLQRRELLQRGLPHGADERLTVPSAGMARNMVDIRSSNVATQLRLYSAGRGFRAV